MHVLGLTIQGYMSFPKAHVALAVTRYLQGVYEVFTRIQVLPEGTSCTGTCEGLTRYLQGTGTCKVQILTMMIIQLLPEGTSCTGTCEVLLRSHDGVVEALLLLPPGDDDVDADQNCRCDHLYRHK